MNVDTDKHGNLYGFIKFRPNNIYFNELDNPGMNISYEGKRVSYRVVGTGTEARAVNGETGIIHYLVKSHFRTKGG